MARRNAFASAQVLAGALRGRAIVIASGAQAAFQLRGPADAANLASLIGLNSKQAQVRQDLPWHLGSSTRLLPFV
jgi:ribonuclease P/MRP protein subunit RPP1